MSAPCIEGSHAAEEEAGEGRCRRCFREVALTATGLLWRHQEDPPLWRPRGTQGVWCVGSGHRPLEAPPLVVTVLPIGGLL